MNNGGDICRAGFVGCSHIKTPSKNHLLGVNSKAHLNLE